MIGEMSDNFFEAMLCLARTLVSGQVGVIKPAPDIQQVFLGQESLVTSWDSPQFPVMDDHIPLPQKEEKALPRM